MLSSNLPPIRVAVARDECFCFSDDNLRSLEKTEAVLIYFSPIDDLILPSDINMLYIGNGHLELYASALETNSSLLLSIKKYCLADGLTFAESGGLIYLSQSLQFKSHMDNGFDNRREGEALKTCVTKPSKALSHLLHLPIETPLRCQYNHTNAASCKAVDNNSNITYLTEDTEPSSNKLQNCPNMDDAKSGIVVLLIGLIYGSTIAFYHHLSFDENSEFFSALINAARRSLSVISMESSSTECLCAILNTPDPYFPEIITDLAKIIKGVSEFCDYPTEVKSIKEVTMSMITGSTSQETEEQMENLEKKGIRELHINDDAFIKKMRPGIILTQDSYGRCGASDSFIHSTLDKAGLSQSCTLSTRPLSVQDMLDSILTLGQAIGEIRRSQSLHASLCQRLINVDVTVSRSALPRVLGLESLFPLVASGQWLPDMRKRAGGIDVLEGLNFYGMQGEKIVYRSGCAPVRLLWGDVVKADPEAIVISCCGMKASQSINEVMLHMVSQEGFWDLRALQSNPSGLYIVDHDVFSRPGPRVVNGIEILAALLHPHLIPKIDIDKTVTVLRYCGERFLPVSEFPNNFKQIWTLEGQGTSGSTYYKLPELKTSVNEDVANSIENITGPLHDISKPYTLEELRNESDSMIIETLAEIDEIDDDSKGNELYMFLHKIAVFFGYQQYVDPSSGYTVFTSFFLKGRPCCGNKCRHCPWAHVNVKKTKVADW